MRHSKACLYPHHRFKPRHCDKDFFSHWSRCHMFWTPCSENRTWLSYQNCYLILLRGSFPRVQWDALMMYMPARVQVKQRCGVARCSSRHQKKKKKNSAYFGIPRNCCLVPTPQRLGQYLTALEFLSCIVTCGASRHSRYIATLTPRNSCSPVPKNSREEFTGPVLDVKFLRFAILLPINLTNENNPCP